MYRPIYFVSGSKGGVGKSIVSMAMLHYLENRDEKVFLIDADTANPDVRKSYGKIVDTEYINLDERDGWIDLANRVAEQRDHFVVINTPARNSEGVKRYGAILGEALREVEREMVTLWVINSQRDSLQLLKEYIESGADGVIHVIRNLYHGPERKFELYNSSKIRGTVEAKGKTLNFPDVADRISDQLHSERQTIQKIIETAPVGNRAEANRWVKECARIFDEVVA